MARTKSPTAQITVRVPRGVKVSRAVLADATRAAQQVIDSKVRFAALSQELAANGIRMSAEQLAELASGKKKAAAPAAAAAAAAPAKVAAPKKRKGRRRRTVLTDAQRKDVVTDLKGGATVSATAKKFKCSSQTVMIIKGKAGLVKKKKPAKKKAVKRK